MQETLELELCSLTSGQIEGEHGGMAFPFRFSRGNAVPLAQMADFT